MFHVWICFTYIAMFHVWICFTCLAMLPSSLYFSKNGNKWRVFIEWGSWGRTFLVRDVVYRFQCHKFIYLFISGAFLCSTSWIGIPPAHFTRPVYGKHSRTFPRDLITVRRLFMPIIYSHHRYSLLTVFPRISARGAYFKFGFKGGRLIEGGRLFQGGCLIKNY